MKPEKLQPFTAGIPERLRVEKLIISGAGNVRRQ